MSFFYTFLTISIYLMLVSSKDMLEQEIQKTTSLISVLEKKAKLLEEFRQTLINSGSYIPVLFYLGWRLMENMA